MYLVTFTNPVHVVRPRALRTLCGLEIGTETKRRRISVADLEHELCPKCTEIIKGGLWRMADE